MKIRNWKFKILQSRAGQSLIEVMIALTIGSLLIGAASLGITFILRSSTTNQKLQSASGFTGDLVDRMRSVSSADWQNIYGLTKGTSTAYFVNASGTTLFILEGKEGVLGDDVSNGLVGHWKFDEATSTTATSTYDASGNNNHGTLINGVLRASSTCQVSHCLSFDGTNDYVNIGDSDNLKGTSSLTISTWVKFNSLASRSDFITKWNLTDSLRDYVLLQGLTANKVVFYIATGPTAPQTVRNSGESVTSLQTGQWYFIVGRWDDVIKEVSIWVNGTKENSNTYLGETRRATTEPLSLGTNLSSSLYLNGLIDDVRIYNRALSADEINRLYGSTVFTRYFNVENISRDSGGDIVTSGGNDDPSTQKITSYVEWPGVENAIGQVKVVDFITRWSNRVFNQTDWSGGSGEDGPVTNPSSKYSSSTGISGSTVGSIKIEGL